MTTEKELLQNTIDTLSVEIIHLRENCAKQAETISALTNRAVFETAVRFCEAFITSGKLVSDGIYLSDYYIEQAFESAHRFIEVAKRDETNNV